MIRKEIEQIKTSLAIQVEGWTGGWSIKKETFRSDYGRHFHYIIKHEKCNIELVVYPRLFGRFYLSFMKCNEQFVRLNRKERTCLNKQLKKLIKEKIAHDKLNEKNSQNAQLHSACSCLDKIV